MRKWLHQKQIHIRYIKCKALNNSIQTRFVRTSLCLTVKKDQNPNFNCYKSCIHKGIYRHFGKYVYLLPCCVRWEDWHHSHACTLNKAIANLLFFSSTWPQQLCPWLASTCCLQWLRLANRRQSKTWHKAGASSKRCWKTWWGKK